METNEFKTRLKGLLKYSYGEKRANDYATKITDYFSNPDCAFNAPVDMVCKKLEIPKNVAILLKMIPDLSRVYEISKSENKTYIKTWEDWVDFFRANLLGRDNEQIIIAGVDEKSKLLGIKTVSIGQNNAAILSIDKVYHFINTYKPSAVALAHNHPNGFERPSRNDFVATRYLLKLVSNYNVELIEHFIICKNNNYCGILEAFNKNKL